MAGLFKETCKLCLVRGHDLVLISGTLRQARLYAHLGFTPGDSSLGLAAKGGEVKLLSLTLNEVARTWPAAPRNPSE